VTPRQQKILDVLQAKGACTYQELEQLLDVSSMTVRRDVEVLAQRSALIKTLGGAQRSNAPRFLYETSLLSRIDTNRAEKEAITARALEFIRPEQTLFLDGSSTCIELARLIAKSELALNVITNSALIAIEVGRTPHAKVICLGGEYDPQSASFVGTLTEEACAKFFVDAAFMSTKAFVAAEGTYESSIATLRIKQLMAGRCAKLYLLVDSSKFEQRALCKVLDVNAIHVVITDSKCPKGPLEQLKSSGRQVVIASTPRVRL
jgi:DeoR/GlpR family transcriptional regulator of sugar metabolism